MPYSPFFKNASLNTLRNVAHAAIAQTYASLHTADPSTTGANEVVSSGGTTYARQAINFNAASAGAMSMSSIGGSFPVPAGTTVAYVGFWDALTAGNFLGAAAVTSEVFSGAGTYSVTSATLDLNL